MYHWPCWILDSGEFSDFILRKQCERNQFLINRAHCLCFVWEFRDVNQILMPCFDKTTTTQLVNPSERVWERPFILSVSLSNVCFVVVFFRFNHCESPKSQTFSHPLHRGLTMYWLFNWFEGLYTVVCVFAPGNVQILGRKSVHFFNDFIKNDLILKKMLWLTNVGFCFGFSFIVKRNQFTEVKKK